ncbi:thioredoxin domain-containing protein [Candidatus Uhrbacteria bacterium]|nr:thioredoxin domain-containing protein [Candidatus Uhrbacteria bacterium]
MTDNHAHEERRRKAIARRIVKYVAVVGVLALAVAGLAALSNATKLTVPVPLATEVSEGDWMKGNPEAEVVIVEYSDFQCPACAAYDPVMAQLVAEYGDRILFVYRHFPLKAIHRNATAAAASAEAAGIQGKFWEMHNILFANQDMWANLPDPSTAFEQYATALGLNMDQYRADYTSKAAKDQVEADYQSGLDANLSSTPSFFVNDMRLSDNPNGYEPFAALIEAELAKTSQAPADTEEPAEEADTETVEEESVAE